MTTKGDRKSAALRLALILFVLSLFAQTTESFRLRKTEKRERRKEAAAGFQPGRILFGNIFEKRAGVDAQARDGAHGPPASAEDDANYQGDSPACALSDLQTQVPPEMKPMEPSLLCGLDKMKFMLQGADVSQLAMDPGPTGALVPLPYVPPSCGYNVQGTPPSLVFMAPYHSCFMIQEGAYYVLPMRWQDTQFSLWCPMHSASQPTVAPTSSPPFVPPFMPPYFLPPWLLPPGIPPQTPPGQMPHLPPQKMPFPKLPPWNPFPATAPPATAPLTTTPPQTTASKPASQQMFQPLLYPMQFSFYPPSLPWGGPPFPPAAEPPVKHQHPGQLPGFGFPPPPHNFPPMYNPFPLPQPKQPPLNVNPYFPPFGQWPVKMIKYPAA